MDRELGKARQLHGKFFQEYPKIGLQKAHEIFAQPAVRKTARAVSISKELKRLITHIQVSDALRKSNIDLNLYLSSAKRFADTSIESFELVTRLASPETGRQTVLDQERILLKKELSGTGELFFVFHEMEHLIDDHRISRERYLMQSAFNQAFRLGNKVQASLDLSDDAKIRIGQLLSRIRKAGETILDIDVAIAAKFRDFSLQKQSADAVSDYLIHLAKHEVGISDQKIKDAHKWAIIILALVTLSGFIGALVIALALNESITLRIVRLTEAARELKKDRLDVVAEEGTPDELGRLGRTFNFMAANMKKLIENLEQEVQDRTQKLRHTNESLTQEVRDRKRAEDRFRLAAQSISDLIYEWDIREDNLVWFGDIDGALGYSSTSFPPTLEAWRSRIHPDDRDKMDHAVTKHRTSIVPIDYEYRIQTRVGKWRCWADHAVAVLDEVGRPVKWIGICRDVTKKKEAEKEKKALEEQLRQSQKMEAIGTLAGGIAHDFNNILSAIMGYGELAQMDLPASSKSREYIAQVLKASNRAKELVKHILSFSRKDADDRVPVQITPIVKEIMKLLRAGIPTTVEIEELIDIDDGVILANPTQVHQVLMNLATNAAQAMEETGGLLSVAVQSESILEDQLTGPPVNTVIESGAYVKLTVKDTGPGIVPEIMDKIFDPYFTTKETGKGSGVGLAVVHGIVTGSGGAVRVESRLGLGTSFHVYFPKVNFRAKAQDRYIASDNTALGGKEHILMVDDEKSLIEINEKRLRRLGYRVTSTTQSRKALNIFSSRPQDFDLVITDQTMPGITGEQLAGRLLAVRPEIPILLCTGYSSTISREHADQMGIRGFLMKPVPHQLFAETIRSILEAEKRNK